MSADLSYLVSFQNTEEDVVELISSDLLVHFSNSSIENCLVTINDQSIGALLMNPVGNILWLSHKSIMPCTITSQFSSCTTMEAKFRLFVEPIQQQDKFYYLAPILGENRSLIAVVVFVSDEANSTILLALAHSVGREISEK
ncbi:hypothetical protein [Providencia sneebia]|uniref:Uncharacterized protein n=1 Tax=Providencia sneebia DSM 19967 TaxID=1141660 RepID=K8W340_9GAMM|nr:hypothetical protein [Providencia sneebia]EKT54251.1 hypothetical protein OO7_14018 [Providencia sneebia DSM 19967]